MALAVGDLLIAERGGVVYHLTGQDFLDFFRDNFGTTNYQVADVAARNLLPDLSLGDTVLVDDATADSTVTSGWAIYRSVGVNSWIKIGEEESLDITIAVTNLGVSSTANSVTVTNSDGTDATIPVATATDAGILSAANAALLSLLSATTAVDLDALATDSHKAATAAGSATTNPINVSANQELSFSISQLSPLG